MKLWLVGCGSPQPLKDRFGTSYILEVGNEYLMIDCGPATTYKMVQVGISPTSINEMFITHHHYDHIVDLPCFLLTRWYMCRGDENQLRVYGPVGTKKLVEGILEIFGSDWESRLMHVASVSGYKLAGGKLPRRSPYPIAVDLSPRPNSKMKYLPSEGQVPWRLSVCPVQHYQPMLSSLAYRIDTAEGSVVFTGDTYSDVCVKELADGVDTVVATCWGFQEEVDKVPNSVWGTTAVAKFAVDISAKHLILVHPYHMFSCEEAVKEVAKIYPGKITFGDELSCITLGEYS